MQSGKYGRSVNFCLPAGKARRQRGEFGKKPCNPGILRVQYTIAEVSYKNNSLTAGSYEK